MLALVALVAATPRVVAMPVAHAQQAMRAWGGRVAIPPSGELGAVGVAHERVVHAAAVVERREAKQLHVWCLASDDDYSGSLLLKALTDVAPDFTHDLEPRWQIAIAYFREAAKKKEAEEGSG